MGTDIPQKKPNTIVFFLFMCVRVISSLTIYTKVLEKILNGFKCGNCHIIRKIWQGKIDWFSSHRYIIPQNGPKIPPSITPSRIGHAFNFFSVVIIRVMSTRFTEFNVERLNVSHKIGTSQNEHKNTLKCPLSCKQREAYCEFFWLVDYQSNTRTSVPNFMRKD